MSSPTPSWRSGASDFLTFAGEVEPGDRSPTWWRTACDRRPRRARRGGGRGPARHRVTIIGPTPPHRRDLADGTPVAATSGRRRRRGSRLRERAGIATHGWEYDQSGIVVTVGHERDHEGRAEEPSAAGPFAILPLTGRRSSWCGPERKEAARIVALADDAFQAELESVSACISAR